MDQPETSAAGDVLGAVLSGAEQNVSCLPQLNLFNKKSICFVRFKEC
jgi:hypothetical protein